MMTPIGNLVPAVLLALTQLAACGCSGGGDKTAPVQPSAPVNAPPAAQPAATPAPNATAAPCALLPASEASAALGIEGLQPPEGSVAGIVTICLYSDGKHPRRLTFRIQTSTSPENFKRGRDNFGETAELKGLGDAAYTSSLKSMGKEYTSILALKKDTELMLSSDAPKEKLEALMRQLLAKL